MENDNIADFIKKSRRKIRQVTTAKSERLGREIEFINSFTKMYLVGELEAEDFIILQDVKNYLLGLKGNPFNLKPGEANAGICADLKSLCKKGFNGVRLVAKELSPNRVTFYNPEVVAEVMKEAKGKEKEKMVERFNHLKNLPPRKGY